MRLVEVEEDMVDVEGRRWDEIGRDGGGLEMIGVVEGVRVYEFDVVEVVRGV